MSGRLKLILVMGLTCLLWILMSSTGWAQSDNGSISGFVRDPSGLSVPNAKVTAKNQSGLERIVTTTEAGYYIITNIPPGFYTVSVEAQGFKVYQSSNNKLDPSSSLLVDASLTVGASTETVTVTASAAALQTESASVQKLVSREQIDGLELNGRNPIFMANLVPGTRGGNLSGLSFNFTQGPSNFNGSRNQENLITYDGAPATRTRANGTSLGAADLDSTQEVQVLTANYSPEYGRSSGGQIRILTRSGSSQFHGAAYEYLRNDIFNANTWTRNKTAGQNFVPAQRYNQFGYNLSGPFFIPGHFNMDKNKVFWYWGQEWVRYRYIDTNSMSVPSVKMRNGDFSELLDPKNVYYGKTMIIKDPLTGQPFDGNIIPVSRRSPNGLGILKAWPEPNLTSPINGNQYWYMALPHPQNQRKDTLAIDINPSVNHRLQIRRMNFTFWERQPLDGGTDRTPKFFDRPNQTNSVNWVWTLGPTKVNEFLATGSLDRVWIPVDQAAFFDRTKAGLNYPYIFPAGKLIPTRIPTVNMSGFSGLSGGPYPSHSQGPIYDISDSFTWVRGSHTFKFGFLYERSGENDNDEINVSACPTCTNNQNGQFTFTDTRSGQPSAGVAAANAALGLFDAYSELGQRAYTLFRGSMWEAFAQDKWKVNQKLLLDFGVRYSVIVPYRALWGNMIVFDPTLYDPAKAVKLDPKTGAVIPGSGDRYNGMAIPGSGWPDSAKGRFPEAADSSLSYLFRGGLSNHYSDIQWGQIQPRLGGAYQITPKTVIRAGGGRFFTRLGVSDSIFLGGNPPFQPTANVTFGNVDNPGGTQANSLPLTVTTQSRTFKNPEAWNWNVTVEREFLWDTFLSVAYVGRRGLHLQREANINQPTPATVAANPGVNLDYLRPFKGYNSVRQTDNVASSRYNSLQLAWNRRFSKGLAFGVAYTYSKSMDDGSGPRDIVPDTYYARNMWGLSDFDVTHIMAINYLYELPFFRGQTSVAAKMLGGWQFSGITQVQTGTPGSIVANNDYAGVGQDGSMSGNAGQFWIMNGTPKIVGDFAANGASDAKYWFTTTNSDGSPIWTAPAKGTFNHQEGIRDILHGPGFINFNMGLFKKFAITETTGLQFRAQAFNVFNHPNLNAPSLNPTNLSTFGKITGKSNDVRNLQLSMRIFF